MEKNLVGYRFSPTGEELINYYLKNKNLDKPWLVDDAINEINICAHDPESLPSLSKLKSNDLEWYFFSLREYYEPEKKGTKRTTPSGFWKVTGSDIEIKDKRGHGVVIGIKKTLVYHQGKSTNGVRTHWVTHVYHITSLSLNQ
uniref:NAC domain-containing protein n=2 Tax=Brassica oleracea var. oleracea TaxID=109376 RepID=A0A0D3D0R3_BRAOL